jgi:hypothetical protein
MELPVVKALTDLADSMRQERLAKLSYTGGNFEKDAAEKIVIRQLRRAAFEKELESFVERLVRA